MNAIDVLTALLILVPLVNVYFVWQGLLVYLAVTPRSPLLLALLGVSLTVWPMGIFIAVIAARALVDLPPLPWGGLGLGLFILAVELLPGFIWRQIHRFVGDDES